MPKLTKFITFLIYLLPATLFFSYYPIIKFGSNSSMNFELSLPLIWLIIFDVANFIALIILARYNSRPRASSTKTHFFSLQDHFQFPNLTDRRLFLFSLFPFYATISIFWSANPLRAFLTAGIIWLVFFAIFALIYIFPLLKLPKNFKPRLLFSFFLSSILVCLFCWLQSFLDLAGVDRSHTLLCLGCTYHSFGFPHPSGFAIEPQFMGNLLLAPTLTALYLLVFHSPRRTSSSAPTKTSSTNFRKPRFTLTRSQFRWTLFCASLFSATLFLTFSRGAIYAYAVALAAMFIFALLRRTFRLSLILIPLATFIFILCTQGIFTVLGPTHGSFISGITKSVHQLSLGLIDLRPQTTTSHPDSSAPSALPPDGASPLDKITSDLEHEASIFEGYVAESTNIRLQLNAIALETWLLSPRNIFIGVGLGGAGTAMHNAFPDKISSPKEIVQNQGFSILLELGIVGLFLIHLLLVITFFAPLLPAWFIDGKASSTPQPSAPPSKNLFLRLIDRLQQSEFWTHPALPLLTSLIIAYVVTLNFFSGLPNALQIYLMPPLLYVAFRSASFPAPTKSQSRPKNPNFRNKTS